MNFKENKAIYLQIADRICDEILLEKYKEEERVPSVREYAAIVEVNFNTVMRTFDYLQSMEIDRTYYRTFYVKLINERYFLSKNIRCKFCLYYIILYIL